MMLMCFLGWFLLFYNLRLKPCIWSTFYRNIQRAYQIETRIIIFNYYLKTFSFWHSFEISTNWSRLFSNFYMFQNHRVEGNVVKNSPPPSNLRPHDHILTPNRAVRSWWKIGLQLGVVIVLGNTQEFQRFWKLDRWLTRRLGLRCFFLFRCVFFRKKRLWVYLKPWGMLMYPCD